MNIQNLMHPNRSHKKLGGPSMLQRVMRDPYVGWVLICAVFFILLSCFAAAGYTEYSNVDSIISSQPTASTTNSAILDSDLLDKTIQDFNARAVERTDLLKGYSGPSDPSM